ncbi:hypothetical protein AJ79_10069 [Helicocarpus griseus UAMH5409]|uniref:DUF2415 domain-containing protein n=1 Tax=Helicocarpus griseus UAMH5409 TaxID=1447875 RepID=A0A2B7WFP0_9EURO|nr:hypothetical protein AJ79_10069 [Helicocarpus griseus UAMH5409]
MTLDSALLYRPTDCLVLPDRRKFFPLKIPNTHHQLRHYISTADPDRIYVAVERQIFVIYISAKKREKITVLPFEPKCLTAGLGWIAIGGSEHGDCAFIKIGDPASSASQGLTSARADVDSPLPLELDPSRPRFPPSSSNIKIHEFGGSIVNSITLHRLPGDNITYADEDVAVLSNNDTTVSIYSLTRSEMIQILRHPICMNYAIISPDSKVLAAVGDANRIYFYRMEPSFDNRVALRNSDKMLMGWDCSLIRAIDLDSDPQYDDCCCFTIAFSPSSHLCAVGSQAGIITVFDMKSILNTDPEDAGGREDVVCVFQSSRSYFDGGAVRSMSFSPRPWDLLVWVEDYGRAGVADVRQAFSRRQIVTLDLEEPGLQAVETRLVGDDHDGDSDSDDANLLEREGLRHLIDIMDSSPSAGRTEEASGVEATRNELLREMGYRERHIVDSMNSSEWDEASRLYRRVSPDSHTGSRAGNRSPAASSPQLIDPAGVRLDYTGDRQLERLRTGAQQQQRRAAAVQSRTDRLTPTLLASHGINPASVTLRWTQSPPHIQPSDQPSDADGSNDSANRSGTTQSTENEQSNGNAPANRQLARARVLFDHSPQAPPLALQAQQLRLHRTRSIPRRTDRPDASSTEQPDLQSGISYEERSRLSRQAAIEEARRTTGAAHGQYRRRIDPESRAPRWVRTSLAGDWGIGGGLPTSREQERGVGTAGIGWGDDARTL